MSTHQFIQQNQDRIENIDGNLDDAAITIMGESGQLEFYYFKDGVMVSARAKNPNVCAW
jgi:regulatory protein YycH of two-component signal transduction system YycFG